MARKTWNSAFTVQLFLVLFLSGPTFADSPLGGDWERFFKENVSFSGFVENTTGLAVGGGSHRFDTSNPLVMQRFVIQPELNVKFRDDLKLFISWKFAVEPRYPMEEESRKAAVQPSANVTGLSSGYYDSYGPQPWEAVLTYNPTDLLTLRWGRQFISWGETDGFRLLDVINPQDSTFAPPGAPNLFNLDETRIPSWGLRALYTIRPVSNSILEFFALPGFDPANMRVDKIVGSNDTSDGIVRYGRWSAYPETRIPFGRLFANPLCGPPIPAAVCKGANPQLIIPTTHRELPDAGNDWKLGTRFTSNFGKLNFGLGYIWGYNPQSQDMVFKLHGAPRCFVNVAGCPAPTTVNLYLLNDRTSIYAAHFNYPVENVLSIPINTAVRGELAFYPGKPYNISKFGVIPGLIAGPDPGHPNGIVEKNTLRYALGFDRTTLIPFLHPDDPWRAFSLSFQIFQSAIFNYEDGIRPFSTAEKIKKISTTLTFRAGTGYLGDTILPDVFMGYDPDGYWTANPAVSYVPPWNEKIKLSLIGAFYGGRNKFKSFGFFDDKDSVFLKMRYQF